MENHNPKSSWLREQWDRHEESQATVAVIFAGITALFIAGIAGAFIYAKDTNPTLTASAPPPAASSTAAPPIARAPETTGSGGINTTPPKHDPREDEQRESPR